MRKHNKGVSIEPVLRRVQMQVVDKFSVQFPMDFVSPLDVTEHDLALGFGKFWQYLMTNVIAEIGSVLIGAVFSPQQSESSSVHQQPALGNVEQGPPDKFL